MVAVAFFRGSLRKNMCGDVYKRNRFSVPLAVLAVLAAMLATHVVSLCCSYVFSFLSPSPIEGSFFAVAAFGQLIGMGGLAVLLLRLYSSDSEDGDSPELRRILAIYPVGPGVLILAAVLGISLQFVLSELATFAYRWSPPSSAHLESMRLLTSPKGVFAWLLAGTMVILVAPLCEELFFRRLVFMGLLSRHGFWNACVLSAVLFGLVHVEAVPIAYASLAGLLFAWLTYLSGSLLPSLVAHASTNAVPIILGLTLGPEMRARVLDLPPGNHLPGEVLFPAILALFFCLIGLRMMHKGSTRGSAKVT